MTDACDQSPCMAPPFVPISGVMLQYLGRMPNAVCSFFDVTGYAGLLSYFQEFYAPFEKLPSCGI
jgi:hypothetical protein